MTWSRNHRKGLDSRQIFITILSFNLYLSQTWGQHYPSKSCSGLKTPGVTIPRGDIVIREGDNLDISCILNDDYMSKPNHLNSSHLSFYRDSQQIPPEMINVINDTTIHLHIEKMIASSTVYYCKCNGTAVCMNKVAVDTLPRKVESFKCLSRNWLNLTCTWNVPKHYVRTNYKLTYSLGGRAGRGMEYNCPNNESEQVAVDTFKCFWSLSTTPPYRQMYSIITFTMTGTNVFGSTSQKFEFNHFAHVIPNRDENLTTENKTAHSALISWSTNVELLHFPNKIFYRLMYQSQFDSKDDWYAIDILRDNLLRGLNKYNQSVYLYELVNLTYAHAFYDIRLQSRSELARKDCCWSENATLTFRTLSDIPSAAPKTDIGSFQMSENANHRDIYIYWQQIQDYQQNGEDFKYSVLVKENGQFKNIRPNESQLSYARFIGMGFGEYEFFVFSSNKVGNSTDSSIVHVPNSRNSIPEPLSVTKIAFGELTYELSWKAPRTHQKIVSYTIFWCKNIKDWPYQCTGFLDWTHVSGEVTMWNKTFDDTGIYQFAVAANTEYISSGMVWASCTVIHNKFQGKMKNVWIRTIGPTFIDVNWKLDCSDRIGIVTGFNIYYCAIKDPLNPICIEPEKNMTVNGDLGTMSGNITHLKPYTTYKLSVTVITSSNYEGQRSDDMFNTTLESSPDVPRNLEITRVTNNSITLLWDAPKSMNGFLRYYKIRFMPHRGSDRIEEIKVETKDSHVNKTLINLRSFTTYSVEVSACTVSCSAPTTVNATTKIGMPGEMYPPTLIVMNESQTQFAWIPPTVQGGPIVYELKREQKQDDQVKIAIYNTTDSDLSIGAQDCQSGKSNSRITFLWYVRAVTMDEYNQRLDGPWSEPIQTACTRAVTTTYYLYFFIFFIIVVGFVAFAGKRACVKCKAMKDVEVKLPPGLTASSGVGDLTHWTNQGTIVQHTQMKLTKDHRPSVLDTAHIQNEDDTRAADEERLLDKKREEHEQDSERNVVTHPADTVSRENSGNESINSSTPITNLDLSLADSTCVSEKDNCSLRLRNVPPKPLAQDTNPTTVWSKGYITLPAPEKSEFPPPTGPWSKAMQLKNLDGYSQIAVGAKQVKPTPVASSGYVPHLPMPLQRVGFSKACPPQQPAVEGVGGGIGVGVGGNYLFPPQTEPLASSTDPVSNPIGQRQLDKPIQDPDEDDDEEDADDEDEDDIDIEDNEMYTDNEDENNYVLNRELPPLVDLRPNKIEDYPTIEIDDLLNMCENLEMCNLEVTNPKKTLATTAPNVSHESSTTAPYVPLAQASMPPQSSPAHKQSHQNVSAAVSASGTIPITSGSKPSTPNPYSRVGIWDNPATTAPATTTPYTNWKQPSQPSALDKTSEQQQQQVVSDPKTPTNPPPTSKSSYVPHRQFDCKLLKED